MSYLAAFLASMVYIYAKACQQLNVVNFHYRRVMPMSLVMAVCEVFIMVNVVKTADSLTGLAVLALCIGTGAGIGCLAAMWLYQRKRKLG